MVCHAIAAGRWVPRAALALLTLLALAGPAAAEGEPCEARGVRVLVVPFVSPTGEPLGALGENVGTVMYLHVFAALRTGPGIAPATAMWVRQPVAGHDAVAAFARDLADPAHVVLWGHVVRYGDRLVAHPRLTILPDAVLARDGRYCGRTRDEAWTLPGEPTITLDLPRLRQTFDPIALDAATVERLRAPDGLDVYRTAALRRRIGPLGTDFRALERRPHAIEVRSASGVGWVDLRALAGEGHDAIEFTNGVVRLMRGDARRADEALRRVSGDATAAVALRVDALLLRALAALHQKRPVAPLLDEAERLNPSTAEVARLRVVERLRAGDDAGAAEALKRGWHLLPSTDPLFGVIERRAPGRVDRFRR